MFDIKDSNSLRNSLVMEGTRIGIWDWNIQTGETYFNERWAEIIGYSLSEIEPISIKTWVKFAHPDDLKESNRLLEEHFQRQTEYYDFQSRMKHKNGHWIWVHDRGKVFEWDSNGQPVRMCGSHIEITDQKEIELNLKKSIVEREILIREIHHRVKNNLQILLSLSRLKNENGFLRITELEDSVRSIATAYEAVYKSDTIDLIQMRQYLCKIVEPIVSRHNIEFISQDFEFKSNIDFLVPLGIIITELVNNSIKHAFKNSEEKKININYKDKGNQVEIIYSDNGGGYSSESLNSFDKNKTFGIPIITVLVEQINGSIKFYNYNGACATIILNKNDFPK
jgi:PAS domain S-box-containing protein